MIIVWDKKDNDPLSINIPGEVVTSHINNLNKVIKVDEGYYCLFHFSEDSPDYERNIWKLNNEGELLWKISTIEKGPDRTPTYTNIFIEGLKLKAYNWVGCDVLIDPATGDVEIPRQRLW